MDVLSANKTPDTEARRHRFDLLKEKTMIVSTNLLARAIDIASLRVVINIDLPSDLRTNAVDGKTYLYRIGRCSRFGKWIKLYILS